MLRSALRSLGGEEAEVDLSSLLNIDISNGAGHSDESGPSSPKSVSSGKKSIQKPPNRATPFPGFVPGTRGGYAGTDGQGDWALEREMEILRLEEENESLRQLLAIAEESPAAQAVEGDLKEEEEDRGDESPDLGSMTRRKSSLTVEELEAGAEAEREEKERAVEAGLIDKQGRSWMSDGHFEIDDNDDNDDPGSAHRGPGTGLGGGLGPSREAQRQVLSEGLLGIRSEVEQDGMGTGSAIEDDPEVGESADGEGASAGAGGNSKSAGAREDEIVEDVQKAETPEDKEAPQSKVSTELEAKPVMNEEEEGLAL